MKNITLFLGLTIVSMLAIGIVGFGEDKDADVPDGMVLIPAGEFEMGSDNYRRHEKPVHTVYVDAFYMDIHEVTVGEYKRFLKETGHRTLPPWVPQFSPTDASPVVGVSWHDAMAYAKWAGKRLPTEAEWERAARGGLKGKKYPWGDAPPDGTQCNFSDSNSNTDHADWNANDGYEWNAPVGRYPPNPYGLHDMAGNVWEWCLDAYEPNFYSDSPKKNPILGATVVDWLHNNATLPDKESISKTNSIEWVINNSSTIQSDRVLRSGSRTCSAQVVRVSHRNNSVPTTTFYNDFGFRCVKPVKP